MAYLWVTVVSNKLGRCFDLTAPFTSVSVFGSIDGILCLGVGNEKLGGCTDGDPCTMNADLPDEIAKTWPKGLAKVELGGVNLGGHRNCSIDASVAETPDGAISLAYVITA